MNKIWVIVIISAFVVIVAGVMQFVFPYKVVGPQVIPSEPLVTENNNATTTATEPITENIKTKLPGLILPSIANGDTIISWNFKSAYTENPELIAKAEVEIKRLSDLIGKGIYSDMALYVSIANQYGLLGDGKSEYDYLVRAVKADVNITSGLPWHNLGVLMERLGALESARLAYERAVFIQPVFKEIQQ